MEIKALIQRAYTDKNQSLKQTVVNFENLLSELRKRNLPDHIVESINHNITELNSFSGPDKDLIKEVRIRQSGILKHLETDLKLVAKNHYRKIWLPIGMTAIGIPAGTLIGAVQGNMALLAIGLPIGVLIGIVVGTSLDKNAYIKGKQLEVEF